MNNIKIEINESSSFKNLPILERLVLDTWRLESLSMKYNPSLGLPSQESKEYPCKLVFNDSTINSKIEVRIWSLTLGYGGTGPGDFCSILNFLGVDYDEDDIFTKKNLDNDGYINFNFIA